MSMKSKTCANANNYALEFAVSSPDSANVLYSRGTGCFARSGSRARLRYGDVVVVEMRLGGSTVQPGEPIAWFGETPRASSPLKFQVMSPHGECSNRVLDRVDEFILVDIEGKRVVTVDDAGLVCLKGLEYARRPQSRLSAYDRTNVKGGLTSRVAPVQGINFVYSNNVHNALVWLWRDNQVVAVPCSYFSRDLARFLQGGICDQHNLVQAVFRVV